MPSTPGIPFVLGPNPPLARVHASALASPDLHPQKTVASVTQTLDPERAVLGVGMPLAQRLSVSIPGLSAFPALSGSPRFDLRVLGM